MPSSRLIMPQTARINRVIGFFGERRYIMEFAQVVSVENMRMRDAKTIAEHTHSAELIYSAAKGII